MKHKGVNIFNWLVRYHYETNVEPRLKDASKPTSIVKEGAENELTSGCLIIENGDTLVGKLKAESIILDYATPEFTEAYDYDKFTNFLRTHKARDGAFFYDGLHRSVAKVSRYGNNSTPMAAVRQRQISLIPPDFVFYGSQVPLTHKDIDDHIGTKTDLAMVLPVAYSTEDCIVKAHQIKRTAYGNSSLGKVTSFGKHGLAEEFFFHYLNHSQRNQELVGVHRIYAPGEGKPYKIIEEIVNLNDSVSGLISQKKAA